MATKYTRKGSVVVAGVKKTVYCKEGSTKKYVVYKKRHMALTRYKKIKSGTKKVRKTRGGVLSKIKHFLELFNTIFFNHIGDATPYATPNTSPNTSPNARPNATPYATPNTSPNATPNATPDARPNATPDAEVGYIGFNEDDILLFLNSLHYEIVRDEDGEISSYYKMALKNCRRPSNKKSSNKKCRISLLPKHIKEIYDHFIAYLRYNGYNLEGLKNAINKYLTYTDTSIRTDTYLSLYRTYLRSFISPVP